MKVSVSAGLKIYNLMAKVSWTAPFRDFPLKVNRYIFAAAILSAILFAPLNHPYIRLVGMLAFSLAAGLMSVPMTAQLISLPKKISDIIRVFKAKRAEESLIVKEVHYVCGIMGVPYSYINAVKIVKDWINAGASADGSIVIGLPIIDNFRTDSRYAIIAHELAHRQENHTGRCFILTMMIFYFVAFLISTFHYSLIVDILILFAIWGLAAPMVSWPFEYAADRMSARYVGKTKMISALEELANSTGANPYVDSYSHPSIARRIRVLQCMDEYPA